MLMLNTLNAGREVLEPNTNTVKVLKKITSKQDLTVLF